MIKPPVTVLNLFALNLFARPQQRLIVSLAVLLLLTMRNAMADPLQGDIRLQTRQEGPFWVGEQIELNLDIWSNGFSFSGQRFLLPEVDGAYLLQVDASTIKLSEQRDGETWQGLRYTIMVYPQKSGRVDIPSFSVEFSAGAGYGSEVTSFQVNTPVLEIEARLPPGVNSRGLLVATRDFNMSFEWSPDREPDQPLQLKTGDALTLTVRRTAADVPAMIFSPLPDFQIDGLQSYAEAPAVNDSANRGELTGSRSDSVTFICEREGSFEIPAISFQWWDPGGEVLREETISALMVHVEASPVFPGGSDAETVSLSGWFSVRGIFMVLVFLLVASLAGWKGFGWTRNWLHARRLEREAGESWAFRQAIAACKTGSAKASYQAINLWLTRHRNSNGDSTLIRLARDSGQPGLVREAEQLQFAVVGGGSENWNGTGLAAELQRFRSLDRQRIRQSNTLPPLNPAE
jgi:hypothetical protein